MQSSRLQAYQEITQDYINYLIQQGHREDEEKQEENSLEKKEVVMSEKSAPLSFWHNAFTGIFYNGKYARFFLWDWFAGHAKNNFFLRIKAEHADFISLVDRINKLDNTPIAILNQIKKSAQESETSLCDYLFEYFISLENKTPLEEKDEVHYRNMKALKRDIHDLARLCQNPKRIAKTLLEPSSHYSYIIQPDNDNNNDREEIKNQNRLNKSRWKRIAKIMALGMAGTEICIALAGLAASGLVIPGMGVIVGISGLFFGYIFAKDELFQLMKQIFLGRLFKKKNPQTGEYEFLAVHQIALLMILGLPLSGVAGCCIASIAFTSALAKIGAAITIPFLGTISFLPLLGIMSLFVFCLASATFFLTVKEVVSRITKEKLIEYCNSLCPQENENYGLYGLRLVWEALKWTIALGSMLLVAWAGYFLFKEKCIGMLENVWTGLTMKNTAAAISASYSAIKLVFGTEKMLHLLQAAAGAIKQTFNKIKQFFSSKDKTLQPDPLEVPLNPIQQKARWAQSSYTGTGLLLLIARAFAGGGFYHKAATDHHLLSPDLIGTTSGSFIYSINAKPFLHSQEKQEVRPLKRRR